MVGALIDITFDEFGPPYATVAANRNLSCGAADVSQNCGKIVSYKKFVTSFPQFRLVPEVARIFREAPIGYPSGGTNAP